MAQILFKNVYKTYRVRQPHTGPLAGLKNFFTPKYQEISAVQAMDFEIEQGELVGYIGPNGAGKSTTIKMLSGILVPSAGQVEVCGRLPWKQRRDHALAVGAVFGQRSQLWWDLPVRDSYELNRKLYRIPAEIYQQTLQDALENLEIQEFFDTPVRQLSLGQKMRAEIGAALLHRPQILFLDEPTIGLDVVAKDRIRRTIRRINAQYKTTVILTTHDMTDLEEICHRILIIDHGKKIYDGTLEAIKAEYQKKRLLTVELTDKEDTFAVPQTELLTQTEGRIFKLAFQRGQVSASDLISQISQTYSVKDVALEDTPLEDIIREIYSQGGRG